MSWLIGTQNKITFSWYPNGSVSLRPSPVTPWHQSWVWCINPSIWAILFATITSVMVCPTPFDWIHAATLSATLVFVCPWLQALHLPKLESVFNQSTIQYLECWGSSGPRAPSLFHFHVRACLLAPFLKISRHSILQKMLAWCTTYDLLLLVARCW